MNLTRLAAVAALACSHGVLAQTYITPSTAAWTFAEETATGSGTFVSGPAGGPAGSNGSIQLTVGAPGGELFGTTQYGGLRLDQMAGLVYGTWVFSSALPETTNLQFDFDPGVALVPPFSGYQGRAVFTPALIAPNPVTVGGWQAWDPMTQRAWWGTGSGSTRMLAAVCTQSAPCTFAEMLAQFPDGAILAGGVFGFKVGNSDSAAVVSVDGFTLATDGPRGSVTQYRFAPRAPLPMTAGIPVPALAPGVLGVLAVAIALLGVAGLRRAAGVDPRRTV